MPPTETQGAMTPARLLGKTVLGILGSGESMKTPPLTDWSTVVKNGKHHKHLNSAMQPNVAVQVHPRREQRKKIGVIGTGTNQIGESFCH